MASRSNPGAAGTAGTAREKRLLAQCSRVQRSIPRGYLRNVEACSSHARSARRKRKAFGKILGYSSSFIIYRGTSTLDTYERHSRQQRQHVRKNPFRTRNVPARLAARCTRARQVGPQAGPSHSPSTAERRRAESNLPTLQQGDLRSWNGAHQGHGGEAAANGLGKWANLHPLPSCFCRRLPERPVGTGACEPGSWVFTLRMRTVPPMPM